MSRFRLGPPSFPLLPSPGGHSDDPVTIATPRASSSSSCSPGSVRSVTLDIVVQLGAIFKLAVVLGPLGTNGFVLAVYLVAIFLILFV